MKKIIVALAIGILSFGAAAQTGVFPPNTVWGNGTGSNAQPKPTAIGGFSGLFADPTASIGLTTISGTAHTAMRSDAAPRIDQSISPTWSGNHTFNNLPTMPLAIGDIYVGNSGGHAAPSTGPSWFDTAFCNTAGYVIARLSGAWACSNRIPVNAVWLGADPTGVSNSSTAINLCITNAITIHGSCYIPGGLYILTSGLTGTGGITLYGDGAFGLQGNCSFNSFCATITTQASATGGTTLLPASTVSAISFATNEAVRIHDLSVIYLTLPASGSGITGIRIAGSGGTNGVNYKSKVYNTLVGQADVNYDFYNNVALDWAGNTSFNFITTGVLNDGSNIAFGNDLNFGPANSILAGPATQGTSYGMRFSNSAAVSIFNNKFNFIYPVVSNAAAIMFLPGVNGTAFEPLRIIANSIEGSAAGIVFYNGCASPGTCSISQAIIASNHIWTGSGFGNGANIYVGGSSTSTWANDFNLASNTLNVVGGGTNNTNVIFSNGFAANWFVNGNLFGNTSASATASVFTGASNVNIRTRSNQVLINDNQSLGTGGTAPGVLTCGGLLTNNLLNDVQVVLSSGTGVTSVALNGTNVYTQAAAALPLMTVLVMQGDNLRIGCTTPPASAWTAFNP